MSSEKKQQEKTRLHSRNKNREKYDLKALTDCNPELKKHIKPNKFGENSVEFSNPNAVKILNKALLNYYYGIKYWDFPDQNLCPPIPGRADYIHHIADLLGETNSGKIPIGNKVTCLDIGTGASCIYPIIGVTEYGWQFIATDINSQSITSAQKIIKSNPLIKHNIKCQLQQNSKKIFQGIIIPENKIELTLCNPPFHASIEDAEKGTRRKIKNLTGKNTKTPTLNFAGINNELICDGGEYQFIKNMIKESEAFSKNCFWFSTLVSKQSNLDGLYKLLKKTTATQIKTINLGTGNKSSRIIAWTFLTKVDQQKWRDTQW